MCVYTYVNIFYLTAYLSKSKQSPIKKKQPQISSTDFNDL